MALIFENAAATGKPDDNRRPGTSCPFCDVEGLENVIKRDGDRIWLMNKYRTLRDTVQTVLIESAEHEGDLTTYPRAQAREVIRFALSCWDEMISSGRFASVLMYKNFGPLSGGSLRHPHLQIVGLEHEDGYAAIRPEHFEGIEVTVLGEVHVTISLEPVMGFFEANVSMPRCAGAEVRDAFSDALQATARYVLNEHHGGRADSYNLFFYHVAGRTIAKVMPRWVASPYYIGYRLAQGNSPERLAADAAALAERLAGLG